MPNANYEKGRRKEYKICDAMKRHNYDIVQRTAGSHSPFDIIGIRFKDKIITLVQAKPNKFPKYAEKKLYIENQKLNGLFNVHFKIA